MRQIVVGEGFRLPRVDKDGFKKMAKVMSYQFGTGIWTIVSGQEIEALEVLTSLFTNFKIIKKCSKCNEVFEINEKWTKEWYKNHLETHETELRLENLMFVSVAGFELGTLEHHDWFRICMRCNCKVKGEAKGDFMVMFRCTNCRRAFDWEFPRDHFARVEVGELKNLFPDPLRGLFPLSQLPSPRNQVRQTHKIGREWKQIPQSPDPVTRFAKPYASSQYLGLKDEEDDLASEQTVLL